MSKEDNIELTIKTSPILNEKYKVLRVVELHVAHKEEIIELAAKTAYAVNRAHRLALNEFVKYVNGWPITWEECPDEFRRSMLATVEGVVAGNSPEMIHKNWLRYKTQRGWTYGEVKDPNKKTHPYYLPYDQLPLEQLLKITIFHNVVLSVLLKYGLLR